MQHLPGTRWPGVVLRSLLLFVDGANYCDPVTRCLMAGMATLYLASIRIRYGVVTILTGDVECAAVAQVAKPHWSKLGHQGDHGLVRRDMRGAGTARQVQNYHAEQAR